MSFDFWVAAPLASSIAVGLTAFAALSRRGLPTGRVMFACLLVSVALPLVWLARTQSGNEVDGRFISLAIHVLFTLPTLLVAFSVRFGQRPCHTVRGGLGPLVATAIGSLCLIVWQSVHPGLRIVGTNEVGEFFLTLTPGPSRATAVLLLLAGCFAIVRLQAVVEASRRAGLDNLAKAGVGPLFGSIALVLTTSQILLYGVMPFRILAFGALAAIPISITLIPFFVRKPVAEPVLPESTRLQTSSLLLLGLGLFLTALAAGGEMIHQFLPEKGQLWFRWGGAIILVSFALLGVLPTIRRPLSEYFDRSLYAHRWDFQREWGRVNEVLTPTPCIDLTLARLREYLEGIFGPIGLALWAEQGQETWSPIVAGAADLPDLVEDNPLRKIDLQNERIVECRAQASRLSEIPLVAQNFDLVETLGFRVFLPLVREGSQFAVLGVSLPHGHRLDADHRVLLKNVSGQLANTISLGSLQGGSES